MRMSMLGDSSQARGVVGRLAVFKRRLGSQRTMRDGRNRYVAKNEVCYRKL